MSPAKKPVGQLYIHRIVSKEEDCSIDCPAPPASLEIYTTDRLMFSVVWQGYEMRFAVNDLKNIDVATDQKAMSIDFSNPPACFIKSLKKTACRNFHQLSAERISSLQLFCTSELAVELPRYIKDEVEKQKEKVAKSSQRKRPRTACEECDCCEYYQEELKSAQKARMESDKRREAAEKELECVNSTGMTADFERDFYTPVVYTSHSLQTEISEIKRAITYEPKLVPTKPMGLFDPEVLVRANIDDQRASMLNRETLADPNFTASNKLLLEKIRRKYGEEVLQDALRCREEIDTYNASAGHPVLVPWNYAEDRELKPSEAVKLMIKDRRELLEENEDLKRENDEVGKKYAELATQHEDLQQRIKHMRLDRAPLSTNTYGAPVLDEEELPTAQNKEGRGCVIM